MIIMLLLMTIPSSEHGVSPRQRHNIDPIQDQSKVLILGSKSLIGLLNDRLNVVEKPCILMQGFKITPLYLCLS